MAEVKLMHVAKSYEKGPRVIRDVNITVKDREFLVLVGPSGCGKSTLLRMIAGLEEISEGDLLIDGQRVNDVPPKDRDIAMVFQNYALYPHMTVFENMAFGLKLAGLPKNEIRQRVDRATKMLEIEALLDRKPKDMSGGQRQRVAIGRAIVRNPKVFLFDEPLSNLDAKLRGQTRIELQKLHRELNATIIYVTHDQVEAMTLGDRIVVLRDGDVVQQDTPINLYDRPATQFVAGFIGSPPMNFIPGHISQDSPIRFISTGGQVQIELVNVPQADRLLPYKGQPITLGIRAEHISDQPVFAQNVHRQPVTIEAIENMGNETLVYCLLNNGQLIARLAAGYLAPFGQQVDLFVNLDKCHFFEAQTGLTI
ncbi:sn-glycerol-3-phosphate ABC transporter ATP-binding protein UgpC [Spirosoma aureum]|uniref:sn-glycerol-3-phosphate ABC transporter ATP-binding protein UgpC n=1 Tax=Spirosoma aureum TaxID=2692134 RepID=A0A6G9AHL7_9BACT|nr:sn-glycerol-3-phosphate ABC transporter ATP-binding protein UgpC [Spirosoma aureum]QIP11806.1 sn-glycerol-3-phosphate ABC transporter ATP-binding protein UgpC [Spirosoma aureum]